VSGYHPWWAGDGWRDYPLVDLDRLYLFEVELTSDGSPGDSHGWPERWSPLLERAGEVGLSVVPVVTLHPESAVPTLLSDAGAVARAVETVVRVATAHPSVRGVHLDLEVFQQVPPEARAGYVALVEGVRSRVREMAPGSVVSVFVPALDFADAYDEAALARAADYLVVQGYDLHHRTGARAGPLGALRGWAPLDWETVVDRFAALEIPDERLVMGIPLYGYEWPVEGPEVGSPTRGEGVITPLVAAPDVLPALPRALDRIREHGHRRDPASDVPWYAFSTPEGWFQGWYDDAVSVRAKIDFVRRRGLGGVAFFPLAYSTPEIREMIRGAGRR
jgi:spore germination protein YaaH